MRGHRAQPARDEDAPSSPDRTLSLRRGFGRLHQQPPKNHRGTGGGTAPPPTPQLRARVSETNAPPRGARRRFGAKLQVPATRRVPGTATTGRQPSSVPRGLGGIPGRPGSPGGGSWGSPPRAPPRSPARRRHQCPTDGANRDGLRRSSRGVDPDPSPSSPPAPTGAAPGTGTGGCGCLRDVPKRAGETLRRTRESYGARVQALPQPRSGALPRGTARPGCKAVPVRSCRTVQGKPRLTARVLSFRVRAFLLLCA